MCMNEENLQFDGNCENTPTNMDIMRKKITP